MSAWTHAPTPRNDASHQLRPRKRRQRVPINCGTRALFVVSIDELSALIDLARTAISVPAALIAWQTQRRPIPFRSHLSTLYRLVPADQDRIARAIEQLYIDAATPAPAVA